MRAFNPGDSELFLLRDILCGQLTPGLVRKEARDHSARHGAPVKAVREVGESIRIGAPTHFLLGID